MSPTKTSTRPPRNDSLAVLLFTAWLSFDFVEHVLASQCFRDSLGCVLRQWMFRIGARDFENTVIQHHDSQLAECHAGSNQDFVHVVETKASRLFDPIFNEGIAQSVLSLRLGKIRAFDDETIFAHFGGLDISFLDERSRQVSGRANFTTRESRRQV